MTWQDFPYKKFALLCRIAAGWKIRLGMCNSGSCWMQITLITGWVIIAAALAVGGLRGEPLLFFFPSEAACEFVLKLSTEQGCACVGGLCRAAQLGA